MKKSIEDPGTKKVFRRRPAFDQNVLPDIIAPTGLSPERQWYLYREIREFVATDKQDIVCPFVTRPAGAAAAVNDSDSEDEQPTPEPPVKKRKPAAPKKNK